jgi:pyridoxal phosphate enzyme (YggS family)
VTWSDGGRGGEGPEPGAEPPSGLGQARPDQEPGGPGAAKVAAGVAVVRARIAAAAEAAGRDPAGVTLVAVAKYQPLAAIRAAVAAGVRDVGENYTRELRAKAEGFGPGPGQGQGLRWHMIGRLQRNKVADVVATGAMVHSLDSSALARALGRRAAAAGTEVEALVQVEVDERPAAHGVRPEDLEAFVAECAGIEGLRLRGLMVLPAAERVGERDAVRRPEAAGSGEAARAAFERVAQLGRLLGPEMPHLSMGMSADLEAAVAAGATMVRIGTAIFGPRPEPRTLREGR